MSGALTAHNLLAGDFETNGASLSPMQNLRGGLTLRAGAAAADTPLLGFEMSASFLRIENTGPSALDNRNTNNLGMELALGDILSLRYGHRDAASVVEKGAWGFGLRTPRRLRLGGGLSVDYGQLTVHFIGTESTLDHWTFAGWIDL